MEFFERFLKSICKFFDYVAQINIFLMMGIVAADVILRKPWRPIPGTYDYVCFIGAMAISFAIPYTAFQKGNIQVEFFVMKLPLRVQAGIDVFTGFLSLCFFLLASWQSFKLGSEIKRAGEVSMSIHLPFYPFIYVMAFCCLLLSIIIMFQIVKSFNRIVTR